MSLFTKAPPHHLRAFSGLTKNVHRTSSKSERKQRNQIVNSSPSKPTASSLTTLTKSATNPSIAILTMVNPRKLNGWTQPMMEAMHRDFAAASHDANIKGVVVTGEGSYYSAGVDLSGTIKPMAPKALQHMIRTKNQLVFDTFLDFPKPLVVAVNGAAIGASVTTATLSDAIVACKESSFNTPFTRLGVPPEGCSSVHFEFLMGKETAARMLGKEGWVPNGEEAAKVGLVTKCVDKSVLVEEAVNLCSSLATSNAPRTAMGQTDLAMMKSVNAKESADLADAFLSEKFLSAQASFLEKKGKTVPAMVFKFLVATRFAWSKLL